ncbi:MAG TPA: chemotaxis response regulator protein-glutamate methylesterase [Geobacterales bacterium]|nr:chemotaxis response regulator protein-glutamate methylesterase [Geobacterales bacterium]
MVPGTDGEKIIKVVVVDDSALMRGILSEIINSQPDMRVVAVAADPYVARDMIKVHNPDVLTLDVEMPKMDGLAFLEKIMRLRPMPVIMVSSLTERGGEITLRALELGAVDFFTKPKLDLQHGMQEAGEAIAEKIRGASRARVRNLVRPAHFSSNKKLSADAVLPALRAPHISTEKVIIMGASTGGTEALKDVLVTFPPDAPGILITQHMPEAFTRAFAQRLNGICRITVKEAEHGERVLPGHAYVAPGNHHLLLTRSGANYMTQLSDGPPVNRHRPSVDVLFRSAANAAGKNAIAVILTGMGADGADGMLEMKRAGAYTIAQDEHTCVVFGMPKEAIARGGVDEVLPLPSITGHVLAHLSSMGVRAIRV